MPSLNVEGAEVYFDFDGGPRIVAEKKYQSHQAKEPRQKRHTLTTTILHSSLSPPLLSQLWEADQQVETDYIL